MWPFSPELTNCPFLTFRYARYEERKSKTAKHNIKTKVKMYDGILNVPSTLCLIKHVKIHAADYC